MIYLLLVQCLRSVLKGMPSSEIAITFVLFNLDSILLVTALRYLVKNTTVHFLKNAVNGLFVF